MKKGREHRKKGEQKTMTDALRTERRKQFAFHSHFADETLLPLLVHSAFDPSPTTYIM